MEQLTFVFYNKLHCNIMKSKKCFCISRRIVRLDFLDLNQINLTPEVCHACHNNYSLPRHDSALTHIKCLKWRLGKENSVGIVSRPNCENLKTLQDNRYWQNRVKGIGKIN